VSSNYPPGVSGFEPEIAGYDESEFEDSREASCQNEECSEFDIIEERMVDITRWYTHGTVVNEQWTYTCPKCGLSSDFESEYEDDGYDG
jgi:hypothetical protein